MVKKARGRALEIWMWSKMGSETGQIGQVLQPAIVNPPSCLSNLAYTMHRTKEALWFLLPLKTSTGPRLHGLGCASTSVAVGQKVESLPPCLRQVGSLVEGAYTRRWVIINPCEVKAWSKKLEGGL